MTNLQHIMNLFCNGAMDEIEDFLRDHAPHGSGIDCGTKLHSVKENCLKLSVEFHHMNDAGYYDGWTSHVLTIKPDFISGVTIKISGKNRLGIKEYLHDAYSYWLDKKLPFVWNYRTNEVMHYIYF